MKIEPLNLKWKFRFVDILELLLYVFIIYFSIYGVICFIESKSYCDYTNGVNNGVYNFSFNNISYGSVERISLLSIRGYVNTTGLFENGFRFSESQIVTNCSFKK